MAADQGYAKSLNSVGDYYENRIGVEQDLEEAVKYCQLAAYQGNADGMFNLGCFYYLEKGVEQDYEKAWDFFQKAAGEDPYVMFEVADCYYQGNGVEQDLEEAANWYQKALEAGYEPDEEDKTHLKEVLGEDYAAIAETAVDEAA